jgi:hypothetical protein
MELDDEVIPLYRGEARQTMMPRGSASARRSKTTGLIGVDPGSQST